MSSKASEYKKLIISNPKRLISETEYLSKTFHEMKTAHPEAT